jgi:hypothetical protein
VITPLPCTAAPAGACSGPLFSKSGSGAAERAETFFRPAVSTARNFEDASRYVIPKRFRSQDRRAEEASDSHLIRW